MKRLVRLVCISGGVIVCVGLFAAAAWDVLDSHFAPLFLNSRMERLGEDDLPKIILEKGGTVYCRMKADDFRFSLPPGARALNPKITAGGFDWADGSVEIRFEGSRQLTSNEHKNSFLVNTQIGGSLTTESIPGGLLIKFHYFGDK